MKNQGSPLKPEGRKQYDREFLVKLQSEHMSLIKLDQGSPLKPEERKQYDRELLVKLQSAPMSLIKPSNMPQLDIVKDKAHLQMLKSMPICKVKEELIEKSSKSNNLDLNSGKSIQNYEGCVNKEKEIIPKSSDLSKPSLLTRSDAQSLKSDQDNNSQVFSNSTKTLSQSKVSNNSEQDSGAEFSHKMMEKTDAGNNLEPETKIKVFGLKSAAEFKKAKVENKANVLIEDFLNSKDFEGTIKKATKVLSSVGSRVFIASSIKQVLKRSTHERQMVGQLFYCLAKKNMITMKQFRIGLRNFMQPFDLYFAPDTRDYVGEILEPLLSLGKKECRPLRNLLKFFISENCLKLVSAVDCSAKETSSKSNDIDLNSENPMQNCKGCDSEEIEIHSKSCDLNKPSSIFRSDASSLESNQDNNSQLVSNSIKTQSQFKVSSNIEKDSVSDVSEKMMEKLDVEKNLEPPTEIKGSECTDLGLKSTTEHKENEIELKTKVLIDELLLNKDFEGTIKKVTELISSGCHPLFITSSINQVVKRSGQERWLVGRLLFFLLKQEIITLESYSEGLVQFFESIDICFVSDIWGVVADILEPALSLKKSYFIVLKKLLQPFIPSENGEKLISAVLQRATSRRGVISLAKKWEKTELQWTDFLGKEANIEEFIFKNQLKFLAAHKKPNSTTKQKTAEAPILTNESKKYLFNLLEKHEGVDNNISSMPYRMLNNSQSQVPVVINPVPQQMDFQYNPFQMQPPLFHPPPISVVHQHQRPLFRQQFPVGTQQVFFNNAPVSLRPSAYNPLYRFPRQMPPILTKKEHSGMSLDSKKVILEVPKCDEKALSTNIIEKMLISDKRKNITDAKAVPQCLSSNETTDIKNCDPGNKVVNHLDKKPNIEQNIENTENPRKRKATVSEEISNNGEKFNNDSVQNNNKGKTKTVLCDVDLNSADKISDFSIHNSLPNQKTAVVSEKSTKSPKLSEPERILKTESNILNYKISNNSSNIEQLCNSNSMKTVLGTQSVLTSFDVNDENKAQEHVDNLEIVSGSSCKSKVTPKKKQMGRIKKKILFRKNFKILIKETRRSNLIQQEMLKEQKRSNELLEKLFAVLSKTSN